MKKGEYAMIVFVIISFILGAIFLFEASGILDVLIGIAFIILGIFLIYKKNSTQTGPKEIPVNRNNARKIKSNCPGRSCLDCKHCDTMRSTKNGEVYCKWDSCFYFPETGLNCEDFNK